MPQSTVVVLCTCPDEAAAGALARALVEERLAACANLVPGCRSVYRWEGRVQEDTEALLIIKTRSGRVDALTARIRDLHTYELPEVLAVPVTGGLTDYLAWVADETTESP